MRRMIGMVAFALVVAACGGASGLDEPETDGTGQVEEETGEGVSGDEETLAEFFGFPTGDDPEAAQAQFEEQEAQIQESIRVCMAEQGFEYIPVQYPDEGVWVEEDEAEFVKTQGFGVSTWIGNEEVFEHPYEDWVDPNEEIVDAMSESEQDAYFEALYGSEEDMEFTTEIDPETGEEIQIMEGFGPGCDGQAREEVYGGQEDMWQEIGPELEEMYERIEADPRIVEAQGEWSACMADAGYEFEDQEAMFDWLFTDFQARFDEVVGPGGGFVDPFEGWSEEEIDAFFEEKSDEEIEAFFESVDQGPVDYDEAALAELQEEEIALAMANYECDQDLRELYQEVSREYESEFIEQNRDRLEEIRSAG